jgi:hypothetical protein
MRQIIFATFFIAFPSIWMAYKDSIRKMKGIIIPIRFKDVRSALMLVGIVILSFIMQSYWEDVTIINTLLIVVYLQTVKWAVFDLSLNIYSKEHWDYISDNDDNLNDAKSDSIFFFLPQKWSGKAQIFVKCIILISTIIGMYYQGIFN